MNALPGQPVFETSLNDKPADVWVPCPKVARGERRLGQKDVYSWATHGGVPAKALALLVGEQEQIQRIGRDRLCGRGALEGRCGGSDRDLSSAPGGQSGSA